jgi:S-disulfanyl-L-cysteine oxidoreductase SoxD
VPDAKGSACMSNCKVGATLESLMPDYAKNAHGNLAEQSRLIGATRGNDTSKYGVNKTATASKAPVVTVAAVAAAPKANASDLKAINSLLASNSCTACHAPEAKLVGPSWAQITQKYAARSDAAAYLSSKIAQGGQGVWGAIPMPAQTLSAAEAQQIAAWLMAGAKR